MNPWSEKTRPLTDAERAEILLNEARCMIESGVTGDTYGPIVSPQAMIRAASLIACAAFLRGRTPSEEV